MKLSAQFGSLVWETQGRIGQLLFHFKDHRLLKLSVSNHQTNRMHVFETTIFVGESIGKGYKRTRNWSRPKSTDLTFCLSNSDTLTSLSCSFAIVILIFWRLNSLLPSFCTFKDSTEQVTFSIITF